MLRAPLIWISALPAAALAGGCLFSPFGGEVRQLQARALNLDTRIDQLETIRLASDAAAAAGGTTFAGSDFTAAVPGAIETEVTTTTAGGGTPVITGAGPEGGQWPGLAFNVRKAIGKLGRGLVNLVTGWVEIPKGIHETSQRSGAMSGLTLGTLRGAGYGLVRTAAGGYEAVTFPFPAPPHYRPVMRPEFIFTCECPEQMRAP